MTLYLLSIMRIIVVNIKYCTLGVLIIVVSLLLGIVMVMMTVEMVQMNLQNTVRVKDEHVLEISLHVTMEIAFQGYIFVMETMTAWIIQTRTLAINAVCFVFYIQLLLVNFI